MTIDYNDHEHVKARLRKRRRRLSAVRRNRMLKKSRIAIITGIICTAMMLAGCYAAYDGDVIDIETPETEYKIVTVRSGDTLWGIASTYADPSKDVRNSVKEIRTLNGLDADIYPGQIIKVPV